MLASLVTPRQTAWDVGVVAAVVMRPINEAGRRPLGYSLAIFHKDTMVRARQSSERAGGEPSGTDLARGG
ncbi:hypothetical protein AT728_33650 [Streptomyces silvensis]|uniref:Uncharacterized protein n=1 Tax=Streptomyces silvensis TaxID=1765722 RepID=A0A0W7WS47_9ACTN|nr:hypothetical protein AT728_33650 [Streptomyces silvensis]